MKSRPFARAALLLIACCGALSATAQAQPLALPASGEAFRSPLEAISSDWKLKFTVDGKSRELPAGQLVVWGAFVDTKTGPLIALTGGGLLVADIVEIDKEQLHADSALFGDLKLPLEQIVGVLFHPPGDQTLRDQWLARLRAPGAEKDRLILDNGDELAGTIASLHDESISLTTDAGAVEVKSARVSALVFNPSLVDKSPRAGLRALLGFSDGSRLLASSATSEAGKLRAKLFGGLEVQTMLDSVVATQPLGGRVAYLSDLEASSYKHVPFLQLSWPYHAGRNVAGAQLRAAGKIYPQGLGMHSASRLTYDLAEPYEKLQAELAIDDQTDGRGSVIFRVFVDDGDGKWQPKYASPVVRGGQQPLGMSVDLSGAKRISLLVDFADRGDELDYADWLNARLIK